MRNDSSMTPHERELEAALAGLTPAPASLDRGRLMFAAGRASVRRRAHLWQGTAALLGILLTVSVVTDRRPVGPPSRPQVIVQAPTLEAPAHVAARTTNPVDHRDPEAFREYMRTRRAVLDRGVDALPIAPAIERRPVDPPLTRDDLADLLSST